jgi:polysaccharide pyruvyl transferase WcaK-like protein
MNKDIKILIQGGFGSHNWGDDLQLYNNVRILKEKGFNNIKIISKNIYISKLCNCPTIPSCHTFYNNLGEEQVKNIGTNIPMDNFIGLKKEIENSDVLFFSGSGTLNTRSWVSLYIHLTPIIIASELNKTIILSGQGFTPMKANSMGNFIKFGLSKVNKIFTRDFYYGKEALKTIGVDLSKVVSGIDDAFTSIPNKVTLPKKSIGINISCFIKPHLINEFHNLAILLKDNGYNPIFNYFQSEHELIHQVTKHKFPIYTFTSPEDLVGFHYTCDGYVGMRYHSAILCLAGKTPVVNITGNDYQSNKIKAIIKQTKLSNFNLNFEEVTAQKMYDTLMQAMETQPNKLKQINKKWRLRGNLAINYLMEIK